MGVNVLRWSVVSARVCERVSVFSSCRYMCTTSVSPYLLSSACFKWHKCIVKRHTYLCGEDKQPNTNSFFFFFFFWIPKSVDCSDFQWTQPEEHWKAHYIKKTRDKYVFQCECLSLAISSLPLNLNWGTGRRSGYSTKNANAKRQKMSVHSLHYF